ncbi:MAG: hypothetical protein R6U32_03985 [Candidatus Woesearchaeota archaeon]
MIPEKDIEKLYLAIAESTPKDGIYILNLKIPEFAVPLAAKQLEHYGSLRHSGEGLILEAQSDNAFDLANLCLRAHKGNPHEPGLPDLINGVEVMSYAMDIRRTPPIIEYKE